MLKKCSCMYLACICITLMSSGPVSGWSSSGGEEVELVSPFISMSLFPSAPLPLQHVNSNNKSAITTCSQMYKLPQFPVYPHQHESQWIIHLYGQIKGIPPIHEKLYHTTIITANIQYWPYCHYKVAIQESAGNQRNTCLISRNLVEVLFHSTLKELYHGISVFLVTEAGWGSSLFNQVCG